MPSPSETVREGEARKLKGMLNIRNIALLGIDLSDVYPLWYTAIRCAVYKFAGLSEVIYAQMSANGFWILLISLLRTYSTHKSSRQKSFLDKLWKGKTSPTIFSVTLMQWRIELRRKWKVCCRFHWICNLFSVLLTLQTLKLQALLICRFKNCLNITNKTYEMSCSAIFTE